MVSNFVSVKRLCQQLGIGRTKAYELIRDGKVATIHIGRRRLISQKSVDNFIASALDQEAQS